MAPVQEADDNTSCAEGASKIFECQVIGLPRPSVRWYKDGVNITANSRYKFEYTPEGCVVLVLEKVTAEDQGVYACRAQNSEGSAETAAQLYIKGTMSESDKDTPSVYAMSSFKKVEIEKEVTSQSCRRPLVIGNSITANNEVGIQDEENQAEPDNDVDIRVLKDSDEELEKGIIEVQQQRINEDSKLRFKIEKDGAPIFSDSGEEVNRNEERTSMVDELLDLANFEKSGRRLTTDSGITSRGSSFSSEPDISITEESFQEMKEYLHGKSDAIYKPFEHGKLKDIKSSDFEKAKSEMIAQKNTAKRSVDDIVSMTDLRQEKYDLDRVNEVEASVLAGMYLFDKGPSEKVQAFRHEIPALELLVRKEALENIPEKEMSKVRFEEIEIDSHTEADNSKQHVDYQAAETIHESVTVESLEVKQLNAINSEKSDEWARKHEETITIERKTSSWDREEEGDKYPTNEDAFSNKDAGDQDEKMMETDVQEKERHLEEMNKNKIIEQGDNLIKTGIQDHVRQTKCVDQEENIFDTEKYKEDKNAEVMNKNKRTDQVEILLETDKHNDEINLDLTSKSKSTNVSDNNNTELDQLKFCETTDETFDGRMMSSTSETDKQLSKKDSKGSNKVSSSDNLLDDMPKESTKGSKEGNISETSNLSLKDSLVGEIDTGDIDRELNKGQENCEKTEMMSKTGEDILVSEDTSRLETLHKSNSIETQSKDGSKGIFDCKQDSANINTYKQDLRLHGESDKSESDIVDNGVCNNMDFKESSKKFNDVNDGFSDHDQTKEFDKRLEESEYSIEQRGSKEINDRLVSEDVCVSTDKEEYKDSREIIAENVSIPKHLEMFSNSDDKTEQKRSHHETQVTEERSKFENGTDSEIGSVNLREGETDIKCDNENELINLRKNAQSEESFIESRQETDIGSEIGAFNIRERQTGTKTDPANEITNLSIKNESTDNVVESVNPYQSKFTEKISSPENGSDSDNKPFDFHDDEIDKKVDNENETTNLMKTERTDDFVELDRNLKDKVNKAHTGTAMVESRNETESGENDLDPDVNETYLTKSETNIIEKTLNVAMESEVKQIEQAVGKVNAIREFTHESDADETSEELSSKAVYVKDESVSKGSNLKCANEIEGHTIKLLSADEKADAGRPYTEPLQDRDLVYLDDTHPEIPNIINIITNRRENKVRTEDTSLTEEMEHKALSLNDISVDMSSFAIVEQTHTTGIRQAHAANEISRTALEDVQSVVENTSLSEIAETEAIMTQRLSEHSEAFIQGSLKSDALEIIETSQLSSKLVTEEQLPPKKKTDTKPPVLDKPSDSVVGKVETVPEAQQGINKSETHTQGKGNESKVEITETTEPSTKLEKEVAEELILSEREKPNDKNTNLDKANGLDASKVEILTDVDQKVREDSKCQEQTTSDVTDTGFDSSSEEKYTKPSGDLDVELIDPKETKKTDTVPNEDIRVDGNTKPSSGIAKEPVQPDKNKSGILSPNEIEPGDTIKPSSELVDEVILPNDKMEREKMQDKTSRKSEPDIAKKATNEPNAETGRGVKTQETSVDDKTNTKLAHKKTEMVVVSLLSDNNYQVSEGSPAKLQWHINGVELSKIGIYIDGDKVKISENVHIDDVGEIYTLTVDQVTLEDKGIYTVRKRDSEIDHGEVRLKVTAATVTESTAPREPKFNVEPVVNVEEGNRLSIKCSVTGYPIPEVTWYHHGQQLEQSALWDIFNKDGYHFLAAREPSALDCQDIVCHVENDLGYVQKVVTVKIDGDEVYLEPVLPPVSPKAVGDEELSPYIDIEISEILTANLRKLPVAFEYTDSLNSITLNAGDIIEVISCENEDTVLGRNIPHKEKVCYIPKKALACGHDVNTQVCEIATDVKNTSLTEQLQHKEETAMPERRKMKSPSPKMTSTPKMKRKEMDTESTEELQKRLGFSDNLTQKKEFSTPDSVEFTEYNDGTTRPMFKKRLKSVSAKSGETAQLECTVSGSPLPKILWLKNNRPLKAADGCKVIVDEGTNILVFPQAREEDVGIYTARAMNVNGSIMCSAEFTLTDGSGLPAQPVTDSPMDMDFTTPAYFFQMSSCEVSEGRIARFDCRVVAYPKPEIVWMRDGKVIDAELRFKLLNFNNEIYSLLIQDVRIEDTGRYTCWARNKFGEAMTEAYLNVIALTDQEPEGDIAPKFLTRFYDQQTTEGTATDFKCLIAGRPEPSVTWLLDDLEIREAQGVRMRHKDGMVSLEIKSPKVDQSGNYTCQLSNTLGEATCSARLTVVEDKLHGKMLPKFLKKFDHVTVKEDEEAKFTSVIVGEPRPDVIWLFDHKPISDTNRRFQTKKEGDAYTLIIKNVRFEDGGKITCKASNEEGEVYCSANLHVRESKYIRDLPEKTGVKSQDEMDSKFGYIPTFTRRLKDLEVKEGSRATFECKVMGIPDPEITWMKDGRVITPSGRYRMTFEGGAGQLIIDNVTSADTGVYTCIVSNTQGKSSSTAALKLEEPKRDKFTPDRLLEERISRKERFTPDKFSLDDSTLAKRPYLDTDRYDAAKVRKSYDSPIATTKLEDTYLTRPKKRYDSPKSSYESFKPKLEPTYDTPKRPYESPMKQYDFSRFESPVRQYDAYTRYESPVRQYDTYTRYESPARQYDAYTRYESPARQYDSVSTKYESPVRPYESISTRYESPIRQFDGGYPRYESPARVYDSPRTLYESPKRRSSVGREEKIKAVPKIPFDRPALLNKRDDSVQLSWLPAPTFSLPDDARHVSYVIESREVSSRDWTKVATSVPGTSYTVRHLRPDKEYEFRVRAQNQHGTSEPTWNATLEKRVDETSKQLDLPEMRAPPRLPTYRPIITDLGEETMRLAWRPVETYQSRRTPPVSYRLEAKELPGKDWMPLSSRLRDTTHYLSELPSDRDYMIRVRAENDFGISEPTEPLWIPRAKSFPGVPITRPEIIDYEDTRAKLSWSRVDIPAFGLDDTPLLYMLEVEEPPNKDWRTIARDLDDTEYIVEGLKPAHDYRFRVRAKTPTGIVSEPSPAVSLYTKLAQTRAPIDRLEVLDYEPDTRSVNLSWDRVNIPPYNVDEEPLMYMLEYQEPPLPEWKTLVTGIPTTRYRVMHMDRERDYNFRVRALTPYGISPPSPALPVTMRQTPVTRGLPEKVIISDVDAHSLRLTWRRPMYDLDKPIGYQVEMLESPFTDWRPIATRVQDTTYKVTGLKPTRDYQFRVIPQMDTEYLTPTSSAALTTMPVKPRLPYAEPKLNELTPESVQLSWGSAELPAYQRKRSPIHYKIEMAELTSNNWVPVTRRVQDTSYTVTGLRPNQEYKFRIFAESDSGLSEPSMPTTLYRRPAPRFSLKEPTIRDLSQNVVQLTWTPAEVPDSAEGVSYMVEVQTPPGIAMWNTLYRQHPTPSVRLADLRPDLDYMVRVRAQSGTYLSEPTLAVYIPRRAAPPRLPVEEPYAVDINPEFVKLQWRSADIPTHIQDYAPVTYRLEAQELPDTKWVTISRGIPYTDFKVTGLNPQRDYNFRIRAENEYGLSDPTRPIMIKKRSVAPSLPTIEPMIYDIGPGSARLSWRPATLPSFMPSQSPITYTLFVQDLPYKTWRPLVKGIPNTSYYVTGLQPDKEYLFRVQAENQFGSSKPTDAVCLPRFKDYTKPISVPEVSDFDEDLTSVKLRWAPTRVSPPFDTTPKKYTIETWEPVRREWKSVARGVPDTSYKIRGLPKLSDHLFRVRMDTEEPTLREPSLPVSLSRYSLPRAPMYRPQLYELEEDSVRLSWQPVHVPEGVSRRSVRYTIEQREIPEPHWIPVATDSIETSYKVRNLRPKCDYEFRVKAMYDGLSTEPSYPVSLFRRAVIPKVRLDAPEVYDVEDTSLSLRWNTVDVPAFTPNDEPLLFVIERQTLPSYEWQPVASNVSDRSYTIRDLEPYQDYNFRVRGVYPSGYTDPSPYVPVYRRPIRLSVPVARTEIWEEEPSTARLRWHRAYIPRYYSSTPISYRIEMQETGEADKEWKPVAMDVTTPDYTVRNISPRKDYRFRIRAQTENGDLSEPTPPISFYRAPVPLMKDREMALSEFKPVEYKAVFLKHPYYDVLTKYVPPSMPIHKPDMITIDPETIELSWRSAIVAEAIKYTCNLTYNVEVRCPPSFEWRELVTGLKICSNTVHKLHPRIDYVFRVRAWNEYGCSEASLPVSLYRPVVYRIEGEDDMDDEEFEREWKRKYGRDGEEQHFEKVPPKLPIDTPRIVTQSSDSIWFTWLSARIPAYATQTSISYVVEMREPPSTAWQRHVTDLVDCQYVKEGLNPNQEYQFRVRAETEFGASDPTMPIIIRGKGSRQGSRRSSMERDERGLEDKIDLSYLDSVMSGVPPRMASSRPLSSSVGPDKLTLSWSPCRTPSYVKVSNVTYIIEKRELPGHVWTVLARDISAHKYDITGLNPEQDYMFRVRAKNEFGLSDPTLPMTLYRDRDDYVPPRVRSRSGSRDSISMYVSKVMRRSSSVDYGSLRMEDDRSSQERIPCQPQYITTTYDTQYGVRGKKGKISLEVRGYPLPTVLWYRGEEKIEYGGQFNTFVTPQGTITLEIQNVGSDSVGEYKCYAENASGAAVKVVTFEIAEPPTVLATIKDLNALKGDSVTLTCKVDGFPSPTVKWMKDWRPLTDCTRTKMVNVAPEMFSLEIVQLIESDEGLYACTVENVAGKVTITGRLSVEIDTFPEREINIKSTPIEEHYHVLEEIGRGRYGVVRRVVEISTGRTFAANFMSMRNKAQKSFFKTEFEVLRSVSKMGGVLKLYDAFESDRSLILVTEILSEPELLEKITTDGNWTEANVAATVRKLLSILQDLARLNILHLDIKPSNIRMCGTNLEEVKLLGFGLSRVLLSDEEIMHNYGSVGYASPEQVTNDVLKPNTDMWAVGVLAYLLLSGNGPFQGSSEIEILNFMTECSWTFEGRGFEKFSKEARDFISKLLVKDPSKRMTVEECMSHPWMSTQSDAKINMEQLKQFYTAEKLQRETEKVFTTVQLQSFAKIIHGAKALYQPAVDIESGEIIFPDNDDYGDYLDEDAWYEWQLQYNDDPDSQIYPIQDKKFTVRECRHAGAPKYSKPKQKERSDQDILDTGTGILFTDKIQPTTFLVGEDVTFMTTVKSETGELPVVTWYRDEQLLSDDYRADASFNPETGVAKLKIIKSKDYDAAVYKCVARIKDGRVSCEARLLLGDAPSKPGCPLVSQTSGTEAFLTWQSPASDGNAYLLGYRVDYRKQGENKWTQGPYVTEEYALLTGLEPETSYIFRVSGHNKYGPSPFSWSSLETKTLGKDAPKVSVAADLQPLMQFSTFDKQQLILPAESRRPSVSETPEVKINESDPAENFNFADTISKGTYGEYKLCTNNRQCLAKIVPYKKENHATITAEFELLRSLCHANLVKVLDSYISSDQFFVVYECLSGINIVQYFCLHKTYKEETVARLVRQVLDALQYLEHYGIVHLNLQPSSIVMATRRRPHVKLRDFTLAHKVEDDKGVKVPLAGYPDYTPPEILKADNVTFTADLWTLGALTFTILSGISPFGGKNLEETLSRILFDRYSTKEMYDNVTEESVKFVGKLLCRLPRNRPTVTKCLSSSWLNLSESMVNARNSKMFKSEKLRAFSVDYLNKRSDLNYSLALIDIEKLPKITSGPLVQPILNDKITHRLESLTKIKREHIHIAESLKQEVLSSAGQSLLDKIVYKIEKENEITIEEEEKTELKTGDAEGKVGDTESVKEVVITKSTDEQVESNITKTKALEETDSYEEKCDLENLIERTDVKADSNKLNEDHVKKETEEKWDTQDNVRETVKEPEEEVTEGCLEVDTKEIKEDVSKEKPDVSEDVKDTESPSADENVDTVDANVKDAEKINQTVETNVTENDTTQPSEISKHKELELQKRQSCEIMEHITGSNILEKLDTIETAESKHEDSIKDHTINDKSQRDEQTARKREEESVQKEEVIKPEAKTDEEVKRSADEKVIEKEHEVETSTNSKAENQNELNDSYGNVLPENPENETVGKQLAENKVDEIETEEQILEKETTELKSDASIKDPNINDKSQIDEQTARKRKEESVQEEEAIKPEAKKDEQEKLSADEKVIEKEPEVQTSTNSMTENQNELNDSYGNVLPENPKNEIVGKQLAENKVDEIETEEHILEKEKSIAKDILQTEEVNEKENVDSAKTSEETLESIKVQNTSNETNAVSESALSKQTINEELKSSDMKEIETLEMPSKIEQPENMASGSEKLKKTEKEALEEMEIDNQKLESVESRHDTISTQQTREIAKVSEIADETSSHSLEGEFEKKKDRQISNKEQEIAKQDKTVESVQDKSERKEMEKTLIESGTESKSSESEINNELPTRGIDELAQTKAEEIKTAAFEEIAAVLTSQNNVKTTEKQQEGEVSSSDIVDESITPSQIQDKESVADKSIEEDNEENIQSSNLSPNSEAKQVQTTELVDRPMIKDEKVRTEEKIESVEMSLTDIEEVKKSKSEGAYDEQIGESMVLEESTTNATLKKDAECKTSHISNDEILTEEKIDAVQEESQISKDTTADGKMVSEEIEVKQTCDARTITDLNAKVNKEDVCETVTDITEASSLASKTEYVSLSTECKEETETNVSSEENAEIIEFSETDKAVESISSSDSQEITHGTEKSLTIAEIEETVVKVKQETSSEETETVKKISVKDETLSLSSLEQVDGNIVKKVSVTQKHETQTPDGDAFESSEFVTTKEKILEDFCKISESSETTKVISEQRQETKTSANIVSDMKEDVEMVSTTMINESVVESSVTNSLETAKVTESRETVREFVTNDEEIEEMRKEILEDLEITSADCGKYLMGSHEDLSSIKERIEKRPDEEDIEKETTNRYIDDALMFC